MGRVGREVGPFLRQIFTLHQTKKIIIMLIVSGTLPSGKTVFEEVIPAQELVKEFKIPSMGKYAEFRIDPKFTKKDAETGEIRLGRSQAFVPYYTIGTDNGSVSIRYADQRIPAAPASTNTN